MDTRALQASLGIYFAARGCKLGHVCTYGKVKLLLMACLLVCLHCPHREGRWRHGHQAVAGWPSAVFRFAELAEVRQPLTDLAHYCEVAASAERARNTEQWRSPTTEPLAVVASDDVAPA